MIPADFSTGPRLADASSPTESATPPAANPVRRLPEPWLARHSTREAAFLVAARALPGSRNQDNAV